MSQVLTEKKLLISYSLCTVLGAVASITTGIAWGHWKLTLDQCVNGKNCSCILYGQHTPSKFLGGSAAPCIWVTFGPLFYVLFAISMSCFHGYRVLFSTRTARTRTVMAKNEAGQTVETRVVNVDGDLNPLPKGFWVVLSVLTVIWTIYGIAHFAVYLDGFYQTCNQYRKRLEVTLVVHGTAIPVIHGRLSCQAIFDFMDYMQVDSAFGIRDGYIFTGVDLILGILSSFFASVLFGAVSFINIRNSRRQ